MISSISRTDEQWRILIMGILDKISSCIEKILNPINKKLYLLGCLVVGLMCVPVVLDVLARFTIGSSIPGVIELQEIALVLIVFFGLSHQESNRKNIRIDMLIKRFSMQTRNVIDNVIYLLATIVFALVTWQTVLTITKKQGALTTIFEFPVSVFIGVAGFGLFLLTLTLFDKFIQSSVEVIRDRNTPFLLISLLAGFALMLLPLYVNTMPQGLAGLSLGVPGILLLFLLMSLGMPIGFAMTLIGYIGIFAATKNSLAVFGMIGSVPYYQTSNYVLAVIPMFMLMGALVFHTGISKDLFSAAQKWLGWLPGGLAVSSLTACAGFAAVCGESVATAVTMGTVAYPEMKKHKYDTSIATGCLAAGGTLGILIPPSIGFIVYGIITDESIGKLFLAGVIPGVVLATMFIITIIILAKMKPHLFPPGGSYPLKERMNSLKGIWAVLLLFGLILGGMLSGFMTPNEGGAVGSAGALLLGLARKRITWENFNKSLEEAALLTVRIFTIIIGVGILGYFLSVTRFPFELADLILGAGINKYAVLASVCGLYLLLGCLMNVMSMMMLTLPAIYPTIVALGFDPIWFGVITVLLMECGQITPPVGMNVFTISSVTNVPMETVYKGIFPFLACLILCILLLVLMPQMALYLPNIM